MLVEMIAEQAHALWQVALQRVDHVHSVAVPLRTAQHLYERAVIELVEHGGARNARDAHALLRQVHDRAELVHAELPADLHGLTPPTSLLRPGLVALRAAKQHALVSRELRKRAR